MPLPFLYQGSPRVDVSDNDTDVFFDTINALEQLQESRQEYERFACSQMGDIGEGLGSDTADFADTYVPSLPQENLKPYEQWPSMAFQATLSDSFETDSYPFPDTSLLPQENRKEYERFATTFIDGNVDFNDSDVFTDTLTPSLPQENLHEYFAHPTQFQDGNADIVAAVQSDSFSDNTNAVEQQCRRDEHIWEFGDCNAIVSDAVEIVDTDVFSDTLQLDITVRSDFNLWPITWIDGGVAFGDSDCYSDLSLLAQENLVGLMLWPGGSFSATLSDTTLLVTDSFSSTADLPPRDSLYQFAWPTESAGPGVSESDASYWVFGDTQAPLPTENVRDAHEWPISFYVDGSTDDPSTFVFARDLSDQLPQENRREYERFQFSASHDTQADVASMFVFADTQQLAIENRRDEFAWPVSFTGPNAIEDDASYTVYADTFNAVPQENRHEYERFQSWASHDTESDVASLFVFADMSQLPQENRKDEFTRAISSQGDATETDSVLCFPSTFDLPQENRHDEHLRPVSVQGDASDDETFNQSQFDVAELPPENRHEYFAWPTGSGEVGTIEFTSGDAEFADFRGLPQENRADQALWPISGGADFTPVETGDVFFATYTLPVEIRPVLDEWPWSTLTQDIIVGIVLDGRIEALDAFGNWAVAIDCYADWIDATDVFAGWAEAQDAQ
jgi:hypothetical protein